MAGWPASSAVSARRSNFSPRVPARGSIAEARRGNRSYTTGTYTDAFGDQGGVDRRLCWSTPPTRIRPPSAQTGDGLYDSVKDLLDEYADIEARLADPAVHADQNEARRLGKRDRKSVV